MPPDSIPQFSLGTAALIIFVVCVAFVFLRGIARMIFGAVVLCGSAWVGFVVWQKAPTWAIEWTGQPLVWITTGLPILSFLATFIMAKMVIGFFLKPFKRSGDAGSRSVGGVVFRLLLAVIPTGLVWLTGATLVHHVGSIAEVQVDTATKPADEKSIFAKASGLKNAIAAIIPPDLLAKLDPLADPAHLSLAKLIAGQPGRSDLKPVIDPETGRPYPRAVVVDEPVLQDLASDRQFSTLLRHPLFQKALNDPKVRKALSEQFQQEKN